MAENTLTTFSQTPYVDDFHVTDPNTGKTPEEKNYLRILYKPGVSVQARELNQMQSMIQAQIDKFGRGVFSEGAAIIEGNKTFDDSIYAIEVLFDSDPGTAIDNLNAISNTINSGLKASVIKIVTIDATENRYRLFIRYENSTQTEQTDDEDVKNVREYELDADVYSTSVVAGVDSTWAAANTKIGTITSINYAALAIVEPGVFFIKGEFVLAEGQEIYMIKPSKDYLISGKVSFHVIEDIVNSGQDTTLLDNASGAPNYAAPGADRYAISLDLIFISDDDTINGVQGEDFQFIDANADVISILNVSDSYSPLLNIVHNNILETTTNLLSGNISATLATRTSEESGDYTVKPFVIDIREFLNDTTNIENRGLYNINQIKTLGIFVDKDDVSGVNNTPNPLPLISTTSDDTVGAYAKSRFSVGLEPSVAYVDGYRIAPESKIYIDVEKARTTENDELVYTTARLGNYIEGDTIVGLPVFGESVTIGTIGAVEAKIRGLEYVGSKYRLYLYDITGSIPANATVATATAAQSDFEFSSSNSPITPFAMKDGEYRRSLFDLPYDEIAAVSETEFGVRRTIQTVAETEKTIKINAVQGTRFFDENENSYIVVNDSGMQIDIKSAGIGGTQNGELTLTVADDITMAVGEILYVMLSYKGTLEPRIKESREASVTITGLTNEFNDLGKLDHVDVYKIDKAYYLTGTAQDPIENEITDSIVLDDGQRDSVYKTSRVRYKGELDLSAVDVIIEYKYFYRQEAGGYYSRESYNIPYEDIPSYNGTGLTDVLDFRPDEGSYNVVTLDPNSVIKANIGYYLGRVDSVVVNNIGEFSVIKGVPALIPVQPETPDDSMLLYVIDIPAYTYSVGDIESKYVDNRRYTMRDIGEIEKRIKNLEYYQILSHLEKAANEKQVIDGDGVDRFKNGIIVDSFSGHSVGDVNDPGYLCAMDGNSGKLRPSFTEKSTRFVLEEELNNSYGDLASLRYDEEVPFIEQLAASTHMSVNPYAVASWWGEVKLSPSSDEWKETSQRPDVIVNRENDAATLKSIADATRAQGTVWGSWRTSWTGFRPELNRNGGFRCSNMRRTGFCRNHGSTWSQRRVRNGIRTTATIETVRNIVNNKVIDTSFVPFIRSRKVYFKGMMFRPETKLKIFFDDVDISLYATKANFVEFKNSTEVKTFLGNDDPVPETIRKELITDEAGSIEGYFIIPNNAAHKFRTGEREVVFTDVSPNNNDATTTATAVYSATGVMEHKQQTIVSTRKVVVSKERLSMNRNLTFWRGRRWGPRSNRLLRSSFFTRWRDPLAQSFMIGEIESGLYASSIDLYFFKKSANVPVQIHLVSMLNGYPTQEIIPFSEVTLLPEDVNISDKAETATNFKFETPIYLQAGVEYAIVVLSNDDAYRMWLSEVGKDDVLTEKFIAKNPYTGVMFKSQNASTWTADQNKDFKFKFNRAKYDISEPKELIFNTLGVSATESGSSNGPLNYSQLTVIAENISLAQTNIDFSISNDGGDNYYPIIPTEDIYLTGEATSDGNVKLKATLTSESDYVTPFIDLDRVCVNSVYNYVNSEADLIEVDSDPAIDTELSSVHGNARARYITREVSLNNPADQLDIYLNINRPTENSNVKVYARFKTGEEDISNEDFVEVTPSTVIQIGSTSDDFNEVAFIWPSEVTFSGFQVKIVMVSDDHANVPVLEDFRAIATT